MAAKVLIIEDDESNRRILEMTLQGLGCEVLTAVNGEDGYKKALKEKPALILMDIMMPKMSGIDTLKKMRKSKDLKNTPVLVVSAKAAKEDAANALAVGATEFITKPFRVQEIQKIIKKYLGG